MTGSERPPSPPNAKADEAGYREQGTAPKNFTPGIPVNPGTTVTAANEALNTVEVGSLADIKKALFEAGFGTVQSTETPVKPLSPELNVLVIELELVYEEITKIKADIKLDAAQNKEPSPEKRKRLVDLVKKGMVLLERIKIQEERE